MSQASCTVCSQSINTDSQQHQIKYEKSPWITDHTSRLKTEI